LNKVAKDTRDRYNPVVSIASGATATATKTALTTAGFTAADGNTYDSAFAAGTALAVTDAGTYNGTNSVVGQRRAIADLAGTTRTTLYVHAASGSNVMPDLDGLTEADARAAITNAGFRVGTVATEPATGAAVVGAVKVDSQSVVPGRTTVGQTVNFTVYTVPV